MEFREFIKYIIRMYFFLAGPHNLWGLSSLTRD